MLFKKIILIFLFTTPLFSETFWELAAEGNTEAVKNQIEILGFAVDAKNENGKTALMLAVENGQTETATFLIGKGANINEIGIQTILGKVSQKGDINTILFLLEKGIDINAKNTEGETPLILAVKGGESKTVEFLLEKGANINIANAKGETPLIIAVKQNENSIIQTLIEKEANVNALDKEGRSALYYAVSKFDEEIVTLLLAQEKIQVGRVNHLGIPDLSILTKSITEMLSNDFDISKISIATKIYNALEKKVVPEEYKTNLIVCAVLGINAPIVEYLKTGSDIKNISHKNRNIFCGQVRQETSLFSQYY